jgi:cytosine/adenosine deaminase-related metal-dependent hydrolase
MAVLIEAGVVVPADAGMSVWQPGYVVVDGERIVEAGPGVGPVGEFSERIAAPSSVVMPGMVNAHSHSPSALLKGSFSRMPLEIWRQYIRAGWREYSDAAIYVSSQLGLAEMIRTGTTSVLDHFYTGSASPHMGALHAVDAMVDAGVRGGLALTLSDRAYESTVGIDPRILSSAAREEVARISAMEGAESLEDFATFHDAVRAKSRMISAIIGPSAPHRCSDAMLLRSADMAEELDTTVHIHVCETKGQYLQGRKLFGTSPVDHLDKIGFLGPRVSMAHCVWLTDGDIEAVARTGTVMIHNPISNGRLGSGMMRFDVMLRRGVRLGLATDGSGSNDTQNMFESMRAAAAWHNHPDRDYREWPSAGEILRAATSGSAAALGLGEKVGEIAAGRFADLVFLTLNSHHFVPLNDVVNQIVYCENGHSVTDVMVGGRWLMRERALRTIDEAKLYDRARDLRAEMDDRVRAQFARTDALEPALRAAYFETAAAPWSFSAG